MEKLNNYCIFAFERLNRAPACSRRSLSFECEDASHVALRKIESRTGLQLTFAIFLMRGCFARCIRKIESRTGLQLTFAIFQMRGCFARCN